MNVSELRIELQRRGLPTTGKKADLIELLIEADSIGEEPIEEAVEEAVEESSEEGEEEVVE